MDCRLFQAMMLEAADRGLHDAGTPGGGTTVFNEHLSACAGCAAAFEDMQKALTALRLAATEMAPRRTYLTSERMHRLMKAHKASRPKVQLMTMPRFVASAAAAVILVCGYYVMSDVARLRQAGRQTEATVAQTEAAPSMVLASMGQEEPMRLVRSLPMQPAGTTEAAFEQRASGTPGATNRASSGTPLRWVTTDSAGLVVPVNHVFYDPEESSHWW